MDFSDLVRLMIRIALIWVFVCLATIAEAGHLVGGEISYYQVNGDTYVISLRMYRDCYASGPFVVQQFDSVANISVYNAANNEIIDVFHIKQPNDSTRLPLVVEVPCLPDPPDICVLEMVYSDTFIIDVPANGVYLVNQRCCRTPNALNLINPSSFGSTYSAYIPGSNLYNTNSAPVFNQVPPIALCAGINLELDYSASDPDSDSLVYSFCTPFHGGGSGNQNGVPLPDTPSAPPFDTVAWKSGFGKNYQIPSSPAFEIDPDSGIIRGRPDAIGTYAFGVCVTEYRNGIKLNENRRDFQMEVTPCEVEAAAAIDSAIEECIGLKIHFFNKSTLGEYFYWDFGDTTTGQDTSTQLDPTYTYPDTGIYKIRLIAVGEMGCSDTTYLTYHVKPKIIPEFEVPAPGCFNEHSIDLEHGGYAKENTFKYWVIEGDTFPIAPDQKGIYDYQFAHSGLNEVRLVYEDFGCVKIGLDTVVLYKNPLLELDQPFLESCSPFSETYSVSTEFAEKTSFSWFVDDSLFSTDNSPEINLSEVGYHDLKIIMTTDSLCHDTVAVAFDDHIQVLVSPKAWFYANSMTANMYEPHFQIYDSSLFADAITFYLDEAYLSRDRNVDITMPDTGNYILAEVAENNNGCLDTSSRILRVEPEFLVFIPSSFTPDGDPNNEVWLPKIFVSNDYHLEVRDRWGHLVFETNNSSQGWNGKVKNHGHRCPIGLYFYQIDITDPKDRPYRYTGTVTILR